MCNLINSGLLIQLELILIRQLDIFDGAGSGDGINGRTRTSSEQMLVIFLKPLFYICVIVILLFLIHCMHLNITYFNNIFRSRGLIAVVLWEKDGEFLNMTAKFVLQGAH
jgi:hypothetical protein